MKVVVAPDSFKGSLSANEICKSVERGIRKVDNEINIVSLPLADGGEGTKENMVLATKGKLIQVMVDDPLERKITASYGILGDEKTAIIEMASASGLPLLTEQEKDPRRATSKGTGQLIADALNKGIRDFVIALGGSATNDGGTGMLEALGMKFYDQYDNKIEMNGESLSKISHIDDAELDPRLKESKFIIASDVTNPLCGEKGASYIFGPQKGATPEMVRDLEEGMKNYANVIYTKTSIDIVNQLGAGAAGGMGAALLVFFQATMQAGIEVVMDKINFEEKIKDTQMIITGEGSLDKQTLSGKVIAGVGKVARKRNIPVIAICGRLDLSFEDIQSLYLNSAFSIVREPCSLEEALNQTDSWVEELASYIYQLTRLKEESHETKSLHH